VDSKLIGKDLKSGSRGVIEVIREMKWNKCEENYIM
jgi:hypothetical protein